MSSSASKHLSRVVHIVATISILRATLCLNDCLSLDDELRTLYKKLETSALQGTIPDLTERETAFVDISEGLIHK